MATKKLVILLTILMNMVGIKAFAYDIAVENADGVTVYYNYINNNTELEVTLGASTDYYNSDVVAIPEEVVFNGKSYKVTTIGEGAFYGCKLASVTIPNSVITIEFGAFSGCI